MMSVTPQMHEVEEEAYCYPSWTILPDALTLNIFSFLGASSLCQASLACKSWLRVAFDEMLWKDLFNRRWRISRSMPLPPGKHSWLQEYKRLYYHTPSVESEVLKEHADEVLHVSFSHNGKMFATTSKDCTVMVWDTFYPTSLKYKKDLKPEWQGYTDFSQFNPKDTRLLVCCRTTGLPGEIAVFSLKDEFTKLIHVQSTPFSIFGAWYNDEYVLSGDLQRTDQLSSCSKIYLNKVDYPNSISEPGYMNKKLVEFSNVNGSFVALLIVADVVKRNDDTVSNPYETEGQFFDEADAGMPINDQAGTSQTHSNTLDKDADNNDPADSINTKDMCKVENIQVKASNVLCEKIFELENTTFQFKSLKTEADPKLSELDDSEELDSVLPNFAVNEDTVGSRTSETTKVVSDVGDCECENSSNSILTGNSHQYKGLPQFENKCLIFATGSKTWERHQIGIKRIKSPIRLSDGGQMPDNLGQHHSLNEDEDDFDKIDHLIEMDGVIIGMCPSPDQRFLYVNSRSWPKGYHIDDPLEPPCIAKEFDIHVIDLYKMADVGMLQRGRQATTSSTEWFFVYLDVCDEYVASGSEEKYGQMWDRHYGIHLQTFPHDNSVSAVAFNKKDREVLVTVSDDFSIKIWRSLNRQKDVLSTSNQGDSSHQQDEPTNLFETACCIQQTKK